jgi:hypothetical protein
LNKYFESVFSTDDGVLPPFPSRLPPNTETLSDINISPKIVNAILKKLKTNAAAGPDGLPPIFYHYTATTLSAPLSILFRSLIDLRTLPAEWKISIISPKFKKGAPSDPSNYRPIALTCTCCKILERIISCDILTYLHEHKLITSHQHGFLKKRSTSTNLLESLNDWTVSLSNNKSVSVAYIDYKSAFDVISHNKLLLKLSGYGITGNLWFWIRAFLTGRSQVVRLGSSSSTSCSVTSGVPQGSVLGPLLFNIFINDITDTMNPSVTSKLFADDIKLYSEFSNILPDTLQNQLDKICSWSSIWQLRISYTKCSSMTIGHHTNTNKFHLDSHPITHTKTAKDLGVTVDSDLKFKSHIKDIVTRANQRCSLIHRCFLSRDPSNLTRAYKVYVRPLLEYASTIWSPSSVAQIIDIESVQRRFTKRVPGCCNLNYADRLTRLNLQSLEHRRLINDLTMCFNIIKGNNCLNNSEFFTLNQNKSLRGHQFKLSVPNTKLNTRRSFFSERIVSPWNSLPSDIVSSPSIKSFKSHLSKFSLIKFLSFPTVLK